MSLIPVPLKLLRGAMVLVLGCFIMFPYLDFGAPVTLKQSSLTVLLEKMRIHFF
jgi:hypothetical protein